MADDELWHVRVSEHDIKTLTLEQIDDLYRLDVIDADTQLWQDGMDEWLPLRVVAGLDEEEHVNVSVPPSVPAPKLGNTMSSWPPAVAAAPSAQSSWPPPVARSVAPAAPSSRPLPPSSIPAPPSARGAALAATVPSFPPSVSGSVRPSAPASGSPGLFSPSYAPSSSSFRPPPVAPPVKYARPTNPMPIVFAVVVGLVITLYRNDVIHAGARTIGQEGAYFKLEEALGGPGFGTPRAVADMAKAADALPDLTVPAPTSTAKSVLSEEDSSSSSTATKSTSTSRPEPKKTAPAPQPQPQPQVRPAAVVTRPEQEAPNPIFKQPKGAKKAKGNEFDPLNPNL
jgi:hypothetical protein